MEQHEIRPHDGRLPAKLLEEGAVDHDLLQPREKRNMKQKGARSKRASSY
jgi:hypothetical protein